MKLTMTIVSKVMLVMMLWIWTKDANVLELQTQRVLTKGIFLSWCTSTQELDLLVHANSIISKINKLFAQINAMVQVNLRQHMEVYLTINAHFCGEIRAIATLWLGCRSTIIKLWTCSNIENPTRMLTQTCINFNVHWKCLKFREGTLLWASFWMNDIRTNTTTSRKWQRWRNWYISQSQRMKMTSANLN